MEVTQNYTNETLMTPDFTGFLTNSTNTTKNATNPNQRGQGFAKYFPYLIAEMCLSIICLVLLIIIYYRIKEHRTMPGKIVISLSGCFIVCYIFLILDFSMRNKVKGVPCLFVALMIHVLFLAAFFWTNVMAYDIMRTMSSIKPNMTSSNARYWKYALYAWTMTFVCSLPAFVVDNLKYVDKEYRPNFGTRRCWLNSQRAFLLYFNGPVGLILIANCCMFGVTALTIVRVKKAALAAQVQTHKARFQLYIRLVIVMGFVWVAEFIPWIAGLSYFYYIIAGILNCLHGVYIFVIFVCKARILKKLKSTFKGFQDEPSHSGAIFHTTASATSLSGSNSGSQNSLDVVRTKKFQRNDCE